MIRAIIITGQNRPSYSDTPEELVCMQTLIDRPFVQHVVEHLIDVGIDKFEFILNDSPDKIEKLFGDGTRWGCSFTYHLTMNPKRPYAVLENLGSLHQNDQLLLVHADRLVKINLKKIKRFSGKSCRFISRTNNSSMPTQWTGWALLKSKRLHGPAIAPNEKSLDLFLRKPGLDEAHEITVPEPYSIRTFADSLLSQERAMKDTSFQPVLHGREHSTSIWKGRNSRVKSGVKLIPPIWIGENCLIQADCTIGPNATIADGSIISQGTEIADSLIEKDTFIGSQLTVKDSIVKKNMLVGVGKNTELLVDDKFILGSVSFQPDGKFFERIWQQTLITTMILLLSPIKLLYKIQNKLNQDKTPSKTSSPHSVVEHFTNHLLPNLMQAYKEAIALFGVADKSLVSSGNKLNISGKRLVRRREGLIEPALVIFGPQATIDERNIANHYYLIKSNYFTDIKLLFGYFRILTQEILILNFKRPYVWITKLF